MDYGFISLLCIVTLTGFLMVGRDTAAMSLLLALHLGAVMGLFFNATLWQVYPPRIPQRGSPKMGHRETAAQQT